MSINKQFDALTDVLRNMPVSQKMDLIYLYQEFGRLKELCKARKDIEILPYMTGIKVLKKTKEVMNLKEAVFKLKPGGFKWIEGGKDLLDNKMKKR